MGFIAYIGLCLLAALAILFSIALQDKDNHT